MLDLVRGLWLDHKDSRLTAERVAKFADADVLVVTYTKSGRTWLRVLLSNLFSRQFQLSDRELIDADNFHRQAPLVPKIHFAPDTKFPYPELGPAQVQARPDQKVIFLVRDPRDVVVSMYFHVKHRAGLRELRRKKIPPAAVERGIDAFVLDEGFGMPRVIRYLNRWAAERPGLPASIVVRYEDLVADTGAELARLAQFLAVPVDAATIAAVVDFAAFDSLQKKEREGFFQSDRLGLTKSDDSDSAKVREGRVGGYRGRVDAATADRLDQLVTDRLERSYGYG